MKNCNLCPNACHADRTARAGVCGVTDKIKIAKYYPHMYEEPVISGTKGSGTIFFCGCSLQCVFCQNYEVSRAKRGKEITPKELADIFRDLEEQRTTPTVLSRRLTSTAPPCPFYGTRTDTKRKKRSICWKIT